MTTLREHDRETRERTSPAERLRQAIGLMAAGLALQRANLARRNPEASDEELDQLYRAWLFADDG